MKNKSQLLLTLFIFYFPLNSSYYTRYEQTPIHSNPNEIQIGVQKWSSKNLDVSIFRNGDPIPEAKTYEQWILAGINKNPAWCNYNNSVSSGKKYGKLYNYFAVSDSRGLAPEGWHVPNEIEWQLLILKLGGERYTGKHLKSTTGWNNLGNGIDSVQFNALATGYRNKSAEFVDIGCRAAWWVYTNPKNYDGSGYYASCTNTNLIRWPFKKDEGLSIRCIKD